MGLCDFPGGVFLVDFEFYPANGREGNPPVPVCMVVRQWPSGPTARYWQTDLEQMAAAPFPTAEKALFVAYFASAELECFQTLGWAYPANVLDLFAEFRCLTNGLRPAHGNRLLGALTYFGLPTIGGEEKQFMRNLILTGGPYSQEDRLGILDYCESDVDALANLLQAMQRQIDWPRAILRGRYMRAVSSIQIIGVPVDRVLLAKLRAKWSEIQDRLIADIDRYYGVYDGSTFKAARWEAYLSVNGLSWPRLESGNLDLRDGTFRDMAIVHPQVAPIRELRASLAKMRLDRVQVGDDERSRCLMSPFSSRTGRNQPSSAKFLFGLPAWLRGLIRPKPGFGLAYVDWCQQEFGIAAALSEDTAMLDAYRSGDPYLAFAIQAEAVPHNATRQTHAAERDQFKACALAVQYGMGAASLAARIDQPVARARQLLDLHRRIYRRFWEWSDSAVDEAVLGGRLWAGFGWQVHTGNEINDRSIRNFPMQANGAEMLRIGCVLLIDAGIRVCATVHDAVLIEAPLTELDCDVTRTKDLMGEASRIVLDGFELGTDVKVVRYPDRYLEQRGEMMWNKVMGLIDGPRPS